MTVTEKKEVRIVAIFWIRISELYQPVIFLAARTIGL